MRLDPDDTAPREFGVVHEAADAPVGWVPVAGPHEGYTRPVLIDMDARDRDATAA